MATIRKHTAKDGTVTWRVRLDMIDAETGRRHQPQRTYRTKREAELGLARWMSEVHRQALEAGEPLSYELVASAASLVAIRQLEREWIIRSLAEGHELANGSAL